MRSHSYKDALKDLNNSHQQLICEYCGTETAAIGNLCLCSNCESIAQISRELLQKKDHLLLEQLDNINSAINDLKYDEAIALYEKLNSEKKDPNLLYVQALIHIRYSNYEINKINYDKPGFMEENTLHRDKAAKLISLSKKLLTRAVSISEGEIKNGNKSQKIFYTLLLLQMKMSNYRGMQECLNEMSKPEDAYVGEYARMLFEISMKRYSNALIHAKNLIRTDNFSINALFYIAFIKFKEGHFKEANGIFSSLKKFMQSESIDAMIEEIKGRSALN